MDMNSILYDEVDIMVEASDIVDLSDDEVDKAEVSGRDIAIDNDVEDIVDDEEEIEESLFVNDIATIAVEEYSKFVYEHGNIFDEYDDILENMINEEDMDELEEDDEDDYDNIDEFMMVESLEDDTPVNKKSDSLFDDMEDEDDSNFFLPDKEPGETIKPSNIGKEVLDESFDIFI